MKGSKTFLTLETLIDEIELSPHSGESLRQSLWQLYYLRKVTISFSPFSQEGQGDAESEPHPVIPKLTSAETLTLLRKLSEFGAKLRLY